MRRAFIRKGWVENTEPDSLLFDLRWDLNENSVINLILVGRFFTAQTGTTLQSFS